MGPTPPGTGVMKPALSLASLYATSPTILFPLGFVSSDQGGKKNQSTASELQSRCLFLGYDNYDSLFPKMKLSLG